MHYKNPILFGDDEFRHEFSENLCDTYNLIHWAIIADHLKIDGDAETELERIRQLSIDLLLETELEHQRTGKEFDECFEDIFFDTYINNHELSLAVALNCVLKVYFHNDNHQKDLSLRELTRANFYFGLFVAHRDSLMRSRKRNREAADRRWENNGTKELHIKIVNYYRENYADSMTKEDAAWEISQLEWCKLSAERVIKLLAPDYIYKIMKVQGLLW